MPTITKRAAPVAGAIVDNILANSQYEFAPFDGTIEVGAIAGAPGVTLAIFSGPDVLAEPGTQCPWLTGIQTIGTPAAPVEGMPKYPDDYHWEDEVAHGDRLKVTVQNTNAAGIAIPVNVVLRLTPA